MVVSNKSNSDKSSPKEGINKAVVDLSASFVMVPVSIGGVNHIPSEATIEEHWRSLRKCLWSQLVKQERNQSRISYHGNHLLSPCGANVVFR